jgi:hypothetical protein
MAKHNIYCIIVSAGQESGCGFTGSSGSEPLPVSHSPSETDWEECSSRLTHMVAGRIPFLVGCWTKALVLYKLLARGLPQGFAIRVSP